ncbi:helix-turn-helix transcriptional regulator [Ilumatobacter nonamiensis]|uniref:helix-turn-helix transcriptional regulator n=1 Tax=Ilumatobacter nonamiensis TaxID=467093 RepID=UPI000349AC18|nr:helix-turn-helix domain-containing protein [Ilumatobacter nonamiensis]
MSDPAVNLDVLKALGDNTRYAIYLELARSAHPLATADIAESLGLHANTVRPHLERMRDAGLLAVEVGGRGDVGRPQHRYSVSPDAPSLGLEPPSIPVLARMVLAMARRLGASADDAEAVGFDEGQRRSRPFSTAPSTLEALVSDLDRLGFDPTVSDAERPTDTDDSTPIVDDGAAVVAFANCPFSDLAEQHPELVCGLHRGLVAGFVAGMGDAETRDFCSLTSRTPCQVTVAAR